MQLKKFVTGAGMSEVLEFTRGQITVYENKATIFIFPIDSNTNEHIEEYKIYGDNSMLIECHSPVQKGDKNIFVKESIIGKTIEFKQYRINHNLPNKPLVEITLNGVIERFKNSEYVVWVEKEAQNYYINPGDISEYLKEEQKTYTLKECVDIRVVRVQDITNDEVDKMLPPSVVNLNHKNWYNNQMKEQNVDQLYSDNDYVFLITFQFTEDTCYLGLEPWKPQPGEWCWFEGTPQPFLARFKRERSLTERTGAAYKYKYEIEDGEWFKHCEPFIGELPIFLKDA